MVSESNLNGLQAIIIGIVIFVAMINIEAINNAITTYPAAIIILAFLWFFNRTKVSKKIVKITNR